MAYKLVVEVVLQDAMTMKMGVVTTTLNRRKLLDVCVLCNSLGHWALQCLFCMQKLHSSKLTFVGGLVWLLKNGLLGTTRTNKLDTWERPFPAWVLRCVSSVKRSLTTVLTKGWWWWCGIFPWSFSKSSWKT